MELFINDTIISISQEENDTIQEVLKAISLQLTDGLVIITMKLDGEYCTIDDPKILSQHISKINKMELIVSSHSEIGISLLEDGKNFVLFSITELKNGTISKKNDIIQSFVWIIESLDALRSSLAFPPIDIIILRAGIVEAINFLNQENLNLEEIVNLGEHLELLSNHFSSLQEKLQSPTDYTKESTFARLQETQELLSDLALYFQTGNIVKAIQNLCTVIDTIEMYIRYAASKSKDLAIEKHAIIFKDLSSQLLNALENKDFVLIADLIEYDLNDHIENILEDNIQNR